MNANPNTIIIIDKNGDKIRLNVKLDERSHSRVNTCYQYEENVNQMIAKPIEQTVKRIECLNVSHNESSIMT